MQSCVQLQGLVGVAIIRSKTVSMAKQAKDIFSNYLQQLLPEAKSRYQDKIGVIFGIDPFTLSRTQQGQSHNPAALPCSLPPIDSTDLLSYLVLQTSYITTQQFKAHKSLEAYNQFVSGWIREVRAWNIGDKCVITGKVS